MLYEGSTSNHRRVLDHRAELGSSDEKEKPL